jgi:hypothetical protein
MKFFTQLLRRLTRYYLVKHTADRWILLHFHSWDYSTIIVDSISYSTPERLYLLPYGFKPTQFKIPCNAQIAQTP